MAHQLLMVSFDVSYTESILMLTKYTAVNQPLKKQYCFNITN